MTSPPLTTESLSARGIYDEMPKACLTRPRVSPATSQPRFRYLSVSAPNPGCTTLARKVAASVIPVSPV